MYNGDGSGYLSKELRISTVDKTSLTRTKRLFRGQNVLLTNMKASRGQQNEVPSINEHLNHRSLRCSIQAALADKRAQETHWKIQNPERKLKKLKNVSEEEICPQRKS